ncbi:hypothetical protein F971_00860 [Acinetobacter vivianii]|uniref:Uncharacterized protein n=1 Tax=Acinetobacter vivianii TaxID=1776742 RepID=N8WED7_9GAMM|nr:hypothetical protein [Acinetobacter vivianii]ENU93602.1 hypothetical protein F971_00860 [Acinetobacter vivianii]
MKDQVKKTFENETKKSDKISLSDFEKFEIETIDDELLSDISGGGVNINISCTVKER